MRTRVIDSCIFLRVVSETAEGVGLGRDGFSMTKNKAQKLAARNRAAATGERYVVARRGTQQATAAPVRRGRLDELTHRVPGVPEHIDGGLQGLRRAARTARPASNAPRVHVQPEHGEPRVLVAWQNWIARRLTRRPRD